MKSTEHGDVLSIGGGQTSITLASALSGAVNVVKAMKRTLFGQRLENGGDGRRDKRQEPHPQRVVNWELPDMEAVIVDEAWENSHPSHLEVFFHCEETDIPPACEVSAELAGWRFAGARHILWKFRLLPDAGPPVQKPPVLEFETGTIFRPGNHLFQLFKALGEVDKSPDHVYLSLPTTDSSIKKIVESLDPGELIGRRCRVRVEHVSDEVGDVTPKIATVVP